MKYIIDEKEIKGERACSPYVRSLKHLVTPWTMGTRNVWVGMSVIDPGSRSNSHSHKNEEIFYVLSGNGEVRVKNDRFGVKAGTCIFIPPGVVHQLINGEYKPMRVLAIVSPPFLHEHFTTIHKLSKK